MVSVALVCKAGTYQRAVAAGGEVRAAELWPQQQQVSVQAVGLYDLCEPTAVVLPLAKILASFSLSALCMMHGYSIQTPLATDRDRTEEAKRIYVHEEGMGADTAVGQLRGKKHKNHA